MDREEYNKYMHDYYQNNKAKIQIRRRQKYFHDTIDSRRRKKFFNKTTAYILRISYKEYIQDTTSTNCITHAKVFDTTESAIEYKKTHNLDAEVVEIQIKEKVEANG